MNNIKDNFNKIMKAVDWQLIFKLIAGGLIIIVLTSYFTSQNIKNEQRDKKIVEFEENYIQSSSTGNSSAFAEEQPQKVIKIIVDVKGEVNNPGVYEFEQGSRVMDAIEAAGGLTEKADRNEVNLAEKLYDAMDITVPSIKASKTSSASKASGGSSNKKPVVDNSTLIVNINTASAEQLTQLINIGPSLAKMIVDYREEKGPFQSKEHIMRVKGIGVSVYEGIKDNITI